MQNIIIMASQDTIIRVSYEKPTNDESECMVPEKQLMWINTQKGPS